MKDPEEEPTTWQDLAPDPMVLVITRSEIESGDHSNAIQFLFRLTASDDSIRFWFERVDIAIDGYNHVPDELDEIPAVRDFVQELDRSFPYWLFFLTKHGLGLQCLLHCHLPPFLTESARAKIHPPIVEELLLKRWFPAMNTLCRRVGFSEEQGIELSERVFNCLGHGPLGLV